MVGGTLNAPRSLYKLNLSSFLPSPSLPPLLLFWSLERSLKTKETHCWFAAPCPLWWTTSLFLIFRPLSHASKYLKTYYAPSDVVILSCYYHQFPCMGALLSSCFTDKPISFKYCSIRHGNQPYQKGSWSWMLMSRQVSLPWQWLTNPLSKYG